jgi:Cu(I)/Ag(I) efflux system periplasmic protein CusF
MKAIALIIAVAAAASVAACGPSSDMKGMEKKTMSKEGDTKGMDMKGMESVGKAPGTVHQVVGVVKSVDPAKSTVTLDHEPVKSLNWSAMTMSFEVKDKALLDKLQTGKKVEFEFVQQGKDNIITAVK